MEQKPPFLTRAVPKGFHQGKGEQSSSQVKKELSPSIDGSSEAEWHFMKRLISTHAVYLKLGPTFGIGSYNCISLIEVPPN